MEKREIGAILLTCEKFSTMHFSKVDKMAPFFPFFHFLVANFSAQRSRIVNCDCGAGEEVVSDQGGSRGSMPVPLRHRRPSYRGTLLVSSVFSQAWTCNFVFGTALPRPLPNWARHRIQPLSSRRGLHGYSPSTLFVLESYPLPWKIGFSP
jgi:hypothetical protein